MPGPPVTLGTVISGQAQGQASDKWGVCVNISIPPQIVYASYVCNVVKYATISPARPGCVLLKFAHRPTLLHRSNTNIEYFIKMATQAEFYLCYPQSALMISGHCFLIKTLSLKIPPDTAVSVVTDHLALVTPMWSNQRLLLSGGIQEIAILLQTHAQDKTLNHRCRQERCCMLLLIVIKRNNWSGLWTISRKLWCVLFILDPGFLSIICPRYKCGPPSSVPSLSLSPYFLVLGYLPICIHISVMISSISLLCPYSFLL